MAKQSATEQEEKAWWKEKEDYQRAPDIPNEKGPSFRFYYPDPSQGIRCFRAVRFKSPRQRTLFDLSAMPLIYLHPVFSPGSEIVGSGITIRDMDTRKIICYKGEKDKRGIVTADSELSYRWDCDPGMDHSSAPIVAAYFNNGEIINVVLDQDLLGKNERLYGKIDPNKTDYENEGLVSLFKRATVKALEQIVKPSSFEDVQAVVRRLDPEFIKAFRAILD